MFRKKVDKSITRVDKIVTGLIIGGALASIFGASKTSIGKKILLKGYNSIRKIFGFSYHVFGEGLVKIIVLLKRKK